jgi:DNA polymerase-3 subunit delta'
LVRFDAPTVQETALALEALGEDAQTALACAHLALGDGERARELSGAEGHALRASAERFARAAIAGETARTQPWSGVLAAVRSRGEVIHAALEARKKDDLQLYPRKEQKRIETEWTERIRRARRRVETGALDLALQVVGLWYSDLACLAWGARDLVRNVDRLPDLESEAGIDPQRLRAAIEAVEDTRLRFQLNVSEELACESLAYRLERLLAA